jgi:hypothetical protein
MNRWGAGYTKRENFCNVCMALKTFLEFVIDEAYHSSTTCTSISLHRFGNDEPLAILSCLQLIMCTLATARLNTIYSISINQWTTLSPLK